MQGNSFTKMNGNTITEVTRRSIADAITLHGISWAGRFEEQDFLVRLYDLKQMPSKDSRYKDASGDIWKHRVMNSDWQDDWVFYDDRFNLMQGSDESFLRFLCEMLHPIVQRDPDEVERIKDTLNEFLVKDGWELREEMEISERPVFAAFRIVPGVEVAEAAKPVTEAIDTDYVNRQVTRMQAALTADPEAAIGTAKDFLETISKTILTERGVTYTSDEKMPRLVKQVFKSMELIPNGVLESGRTDDTLKRLLSNLASVSDGLAELRNLHGTGHGKEAKSEGLNLRHARLAVSAATALAVFLWETHQA